MKRLINVRVPVLLACALCIGVLIGFTLFEYGVNILWVIAVVPVAAVIFIICAIFVRKDCVLFTITFAAVFIIAGAINYYLRYDISIDTESIVLFSGVKNRIYRILFDNLDNDSAAVIYAMLTGDTQGIENGTLNSFRYGGIAHIFAVSGLHIGIVYGIIRYFCKKVRMNKYIAAAVSLLFVFLYAGVCGFSLSSVRAAIMCTVSTLARLTYRKYDSMNALAVSVILIMLLIPSSLFAVGFQLSVCAVGCIFLLSKNIEKILRKIKIPRKISSAVGVSLSAQAGVLPVMLAHFGYISGAGLLLNIIIVPLLSVLFVIIFLATIISCILPFIAAAIIPVAALPLQAVISFLISAGFEKALITGFGTVAFAPLFFIILLTLSDKLNLKPIWRACAFSTSLLITVLYVLLI